MEPIEEIIKRSVSHVVMNYTPTDDGKGYFTVTLLDEAYQLSDGDGTAFDNYWFGDTLLEALQNMAKAVLDKPKK